MFYKLNPQKGLVFLTENSFRKKWGSPVSPTFAQAGDRIRTAATTRSTAMTIALSSELSPVSSPFRISRSVSNPDWIRTDLHYERPPGSEWIMRIRIRFLKTVYGNCC